MNTTYSLYSNPDFYGGYGYLAESNTGHSVNQQWTPGASGEVPMSEPQAKARAEALIAEWQASEAPAP